MYRSTSQAPIKNRQQFPSSRNCGGGTLTLCQFSKGQNNRTRPQLSQSSRISQFTAASGELGQASSVLLPPAAAAPRGCSGQSEASTPLAFLGAARAEAARAPAGFHSRKTSSRHPTGWLYHAVAGASLLPRGRAPGPRPLALKCGCTQHFSSGGKVV